MIPFLTLWAKLPSQRQPPSLSECLLHYKTNHTFMTPRPLRVTMWKVGVSFVQCVSQCMVCATSLGPVVVFRVRSLGTPPGNATRMLSPKPTVFIVFVFLLINWSSHKNKEFLLDVCAWNLKEKIFNLNRQFTNCMFCLNFLNKMLNIWMIKLNII